MLLIEGRAIKTAVPSRATRIDARPRGIKITQNLQPRYEESFSVSKTAPLSSFATFGRLSFTNPFGFNNVMASYNRHGVGVSIPPIRDVNYVSEQPIHGD